MKYKEIFKLWHFWLFGFIYSIASLISEINYDGYFYLGFYPSYLGTIIASFVVILFFYTMGWLIFGRDKKE